MFKKYYLIYIFFILLMLFGCSTMPKIDNYELYYKQLDQKIKTGQNKEATINVFGSPNLIFTGEKEKEVWLYNTIGVDNQKYELFLFFNKNNLLEKYELIDPSLE